MKATPEQPKIFHITHFNNLSQIVSDGRIWSDAMRASHGRECEVIGMSQIKKRRLEELEVECCRGTRVGEYVPFYFCPRSIMLFILHRGNHPDVTYRGGQAPILHLQADLREVVRHAQIENALWAFSLSNAGARYTTFRSSWEQLDEVNWDAVEASDFRDVRIKEGKQAEFLIKDSLPWSLVEKIGVINESVRQQVKRIIGENSHCPPVEVESGWYF